MTREIVVELCLTRIILQSENHNYLFIRFDNNFVFILGEFVFQNNCNK